MPGWNRGKGIKYRRFTGNGPRHAYSSFDLTSRNVKRLAPTAPGPRRSRCAPIALRCPVARGLRWACLLFPFRLGHPRLDVANLEGLDGGHQIHHLRGLARRQHASRAGGKDRARGLDQVAGAGDLRQIERHRAIMPRRQQPPHAKAQRYPIACQGRLDELARERLGRAVKQGLDRDRGLVAGAFRPPPRPAAPGGRERRLATAWHVACRGIEVIHGRPDPPRLAALPGAGARAMR